MDWDLCQGHGQCEDACPEVFKVEDDGLAHVLIEHPPESLYAKVQDAYVRCPADAIFLFDDEET